MEGGDGDRPRWVFLSLLRLCRSSVLHTWLGSDAKLARRCCFIDDLGTVLALGFIFAPFTLRTLIFAGVAIVVFTILPWLTPRFFRLYGNRPSELETKFLLLCLLGMGALAGWADSEAVLPAYVIGMVLAGTVGKDHALIRRLRT